MDIGLEDTIKTPESKVDLDLVAKAKTLSGEDAANFIADLLEQNIFLYEPFLELKNLKDLQGTKYEKYYLLLKCFAYGTYKDYVTHKNLYPPLSSLHIRKLRLLTIVRCACIQKRILYDHLLQELELEDAFDIENLIIDAIYMGMMMAKFNQAQRYIMVEHVVSLDVRRDLLSSMSEKYEEWGEICGSMLNVISNQMDHVKELKDREEEQMEVTEKDKQVNNYDME